MAGLWRLAHTFDPAGGGHRRGDGALHALSRARGAGGLGSALCKDLLDRIDVHGKALAEEFFLLGRQRFHRHVLDLFLSAVVVAVVGSDEHIRIRKCHAGHELRDPFVHEVMDRHGAAAFDIGAKCGYIIGAVHLCGGDACGPHFGHIALVPVKTDHAVFGNQPLGVFDRLAHLFHKIHSHRIVVVVAKLHAGFGRVPACLVQELFAHLAAVAGGLCDDLDLWHVRRQVVQPVAVVFGELIADQQDQVEILIGLRAQAGQGHRFEQAKPLFEPILGPEIGHAFLDAVVANLKAADGRVGKPAKSDHLHHVVPYSVDSAALFFDGDLVIIAPHADLINVDHLRGHRASVAGHKRAIDPVFEIVFPGGVVLVVGVGRDSGAVLVDFERTGCGFRVQADHEIGPASAQLGNAGKVVILDIVADIVEWT
mmetsp:Transcript_13496/g.21535  ORF Transcript_13496/g.21535 Transcript_13496/m.21535 type:complete len:425 (-) Transcript_13496:478-1752(-)